MKSNISKIVALLICVLMAFSIVGCQQTTPEAPATLPADRYDATVTPRTGANAETPLVISISTLDGKFSPFFSTSAYDVDVQGQTQLGLLYYDKTGAPQAGVEYPCYAYSYTQEVNDDNSLSTYKFVLKNGLVFSDGTPITSKDVLFSIYTVCDPMYDGSTTLYTLRVQGMSEYRLQTSAEALDVADAIIEAGITTAEDGTMAYPAADGATAEQQAAFWGYFDQAGEMFAQEIVDYCVARGYVADSNDVATAAAEWGFELAPEATAADFFAAIVAAYGYDLSDAGINYEKAGDTRIETYCRDLYLANEGAIEGGVASISGITSGVEVCEDGVEREYIQVVCDRVDPTAIFKLGVYVTPWEYYTEGFTGELNEFGVALNNPEFMQCLKDKNVKPVGAGPYIFEEYKDNVVYYTANDNFCMGSPKIKNFRYQEITLGSEMDSVKTDTVHFTDPSASTEIINDITGGEGDFAKLGYTLVDNDGYGYIGMNAQFFPEWEVRKAIAHTMNVQLCIDDYYGELATVNYRTMTKIQWAYPENPENLFPYDGTGETSKALFLEAGYIYDEAANIMYYPEGHEKAGQPFTFKATLPSDAADHPAGSVFLDMQQVLASIGVKMDIETDTSLLAKLNTAYESGIQLWTAAWGSGGTDPDMFQVWCSDPGKNQATSPTAKGLYWLYQNGSDEQKALLMELNELIDAGRSTLDVEERKVIYAQALELSTSTATEIPTYQRKNMYVFNKEVINADTLFSGEDVTPFQSPISYIWDVELLG